MTKTRLYKNGTPFEFDLEAKAAIRDISGKECRVIIEDMDGKRLMNAHVLMDNVSTETVDLSDVEMNEEDGNLSMTKRFGMRLDVSGLMYFVDFKEAMDEYLKTGRLSS